MTLHPNWEDHLRLRELADHNSQNPPEAACAINPEQTQRAYAFCAQTTSQHCRSASLAMASVPPTKRQALQALYALYQTADDLINVQKEPEAFEAWRWRVLLPSQTPDDPVLLAWADTSRRFAIPPGYVRQLLHGLGRDLRPQPLHTFDDFADYAYGVAGSVALISLRIIGSTSAEAIAFAIKTGVALQLTKVLRDINEDWSVGRIYLPREELGQFGVSLSNLNDRRVNDRWRAFMRFQIERNRQLYADAWPGIGLLHPDGRYAAMRAIDYARALLDDIEAHDYDVFGRRAHVSLAVRLRRWPALWRQSRHSGAPHHHAN